MAYEPKYKVGSRVRVADRSILEEFMRTWKLHHKLQSEQLDYANQVAIVKSVSMYHGGDQLYELLSVPGIWHEHLLMQAV